MAIDAVSAHGPIEYEVKMMNDAGQTVYTFPLAQSGNGLISTEWNLLNEAGQPQESTYFTAQVTTYWPSKADFLANAAGSGNSVIFSSPSWKLNSPEVWPPMGGWVIARQDITKTFTGTLPTSDGPHNGKAMLEGVFDGFYGALYFDASMDPTGNTPYPLPDTGTPDFAPWLDFEPNTSQAQRNSAWSMFADAIDDRPYFISRNLWWFGHGGGNSIGADDFVIDKPWIYWPWSSAYRTSVDIDEFLQNRMGPGVHKYRFVFLDGCETATGDWASVFGIPEKPYYFSPNATLIGRPNAFVGWKVRKPFASGAALAVFPGFAKFREQLLMYWTDDGKPFRAAVDLANADAKTFNPQVPLDWAKDISITGYDQITFQMGNLNDPAF